MTSFFGELTRRNVVRVAVAYAIVGWLLVQVADTFFPALQLPEWTVTLVAGLVILGFPLALILSWAYELTPEGMKRSHKVPPPESITHVTGRKLDFAIIGALVLALGFVVYNYVLEDGEVAVGVLPNSVAVLPFRNDSPDPDNAYYASGIHEEILNHLVKISALNVIARTSVEQYRNTEKSIPEIATELNVETVMEGSVRYDAGRIRITTQLNDGVTGAHLWSETYTRDFDDIFAIESDVAMNVANALEAEFSLEEQASIEKIPTDSPEAYALYLRVATHLDSGSGAGPGAIQYLDRAILLDPNFALAYARKAQVYANVLTGNVPDRQAELEQNAQNNAKQALALDSTLGGAHAALAFVHQANWRWDEAEQAFEQALRLSPNDAYVLSQYSRLKRYRGEFEAAVEAARRAAELDPLSMTSRYQLGIAYRYARNHDAAAQSFQDLLKRMPTSGSGHAQLGFTEVSRGNRTGALVELQIAEQIYGENISDGSMRISQLAAGYAQMGRRDDVVRLFAALEARAEENVVNAAHWALIYIALEDYDQALEWLEVAVDDQAPDLVTLGEIKANPYADAVLDEPRFRELRDRIGT